MDSLSDGEQNPRFSTAHEGSLKSVTLAFVGHKDPPGVSSCSSKDRSEAPTLADRAQLFP